MKFPWNRGPKPPKRGFFERLRGRRHKEGRSRRERHQGRREPRFEETATPIQDVERQSHTPQPQVTPDVARQTILRAKSMPSISHDKHYSWGEIGKNLAVLGIVATFMKFWLGLSVAAITALFAAGIIGYTLYKMYKARKMAGASA